MGQKRAALMTLNKKMKREEYGWATLVGRIAERD
jgi:hypothetical protein